MSKNTQISAKNSSKKNENKEEIQTEMLEFYGRKAGFNNWIENMPGSSSKFDILNDKWFYAYPAASESRYKELRENHPDLDPITVSESICELILTELIEEAVGDIVGYVKGDINGNDGINKSKFQVLCSKCKKYKAATKYGPHFHKCIGVDKAEVKDKDKSNKITMKIKLEEKDKKDRIPPVIILKKRSVSTDDSTENKDKHEEIPHSHTFPIEISKPDLQQQQNSIPTQAPIQNLLNEERKKIKSPKYELAARMTEEEIIQHKERKAKKSKNLKIKGKKSMFISFDNSLEKTKKLSLMENDPLKFLKEENNVIVDKLIDSLDKMEIGELALNDENDDGTDENDKEEKANDKNIGKNKGSKEMIIPEEVRFALERLGINNELIDELYHEQNNQDDQDFIDKTFADFENEILYEYYHGNDQDDTDLEEKSDNEESDAQKSLVQKKKDFPIEIFENISRLFELYSQKNMKITMGDIVRIMTIVSSRYPSYVCKQIYHELFTCLQKNGFFEKSNVEIEEIFDSVPRIVPKAFENCSTEKNSDSKMAAEDKDDLNLANINFDIETLAALQETLPEDFDDVCLDEFELDCIDDLLNNKVNDELLESQSLLNFMEANGLEEQLPNITQQDIEDFLLGAEQNICEYFAMKNYNRQANISKHYSESELSSSEIDASSSTTISTNSSEEYSTKATLNSSSSGSSSRRSRTDSTSSTTTTSSSLTTTSNDSFHNASSSSLDCDPNATKISSKLNKQPSSSLSSSSSFCSVKCEKEHSDMSDVVKSLDEMSIEIGSSSENKEESSQSDS